MRFRRLMSRGLVAGALLLTIGLLRAEEHSQSVLDVLSSTTISGYVDTSAIWVFGSDGPGVAAIPEPSTTVLLVAGVAGCWLARGFRSSVRKAQR